MTFLFTETYIKKVKKGHEITGRMPVKYDRRAEGPCTCVDGVNISSPKATKSRAVGPFTTNDGPRARLCKFRRRRRRKTGRRPVHVRDGRWGRGPKARSSYVLFMSRLMHISAFCMSRRWTCLAPQALVRYISLNFRIIRMCNLSLLC